MLFGFTQCFTGDTLVATEDGKERTAGRVEVERLSKPVKVYNLEIEDSHVYYVSGAGVLVHNACDMPNPEGNNGKEIASTITKKGDVKKDFLFDTMSDAKNYARKFLGLDAERMYDEFGKWIGWSGKNGEVYWGHGDWGQGLGKSTFPHLNFITDTIKGHFFIEEKIVNRGQWDAFSDFFGI